MLQVPGFSTPLLPYQAPPLIVAMQRAHLRSAEAIKPVLAIALVTLAVLLPLDYLWWRALAAISGNTRPLEPPVVGPAVDVGGDHGEGVGR